MRPNNCPYDCKLIARKIPKLIEALENSRKTPWYFSDFKGKARDTCRKKLGKDELDYAGCYLFSDEQGKPKYVGISRGVIGRIWSHYRGPTHYQTSLVYKLARSIEGCQIHLHRKDTNHPIYKEEFSKARKTLHKWSVAHVRVDDPVTLYLFEVAAAMHFETGELNCFLTH